jgi:hypothetical protein
MRCIIAADERMEQARWCRPAFFILFYFILFGVGGGIVAADERIEQLVGLVPLLLLHLKNLVIKPAAAV